MPKHAWEIEIERLQLEVAKQEALNESAYRAGMKAGWNLGVIDDNEGFARAMEGTEYIVELKRVRAAHSHLLKGTSDAK